ncbi:hypothetical protein, partial [Bacillus subtilis]|uniref:hypothetical protein n=1 Tax=Bacillus subtilis TaxID=1423 RepID=UPI003C246DFA
KVCGIRPTLNGYRTLKAGSRGGDVKLLQCLLKRSGHGATVTGRWNSRTTKAVNSYRASLGWSQTSTASRSVW